MLSYKFQNRYYSQRGIYNFNDLLTCRCSEGAPLWNRDILIDVNTLRYIYKHQKDFNVK